MDVAEEAIDVPNQEPERHSSLWYEDGNVVLSTNSYLYRVHKSILSRHSPVFRDMFQVSDDAEEDTKDTIKPSSEQYEGVPLITMGGDSDADVCTLLSTLYNRK